MIRGVISEREKDLPRFTIGKLLKIAAESKTIISLGPGEPDFSSPPNVLRAAKKAIKDKQTHYSPIAGRTDLRIAIAKKLKKDNRVNVTPDEVVVTNGSTEALLLTLMTTLDPGETVMVPNPGFLAYIPMVEILNGVPLSIKLEESDGFQITTEKLKEAFIPKKTRSIILNTPSNPIGVVLKKKTLEEIADFAVEKNLLILSDEAYEKQVYDDEKHISIGSLNGIEDHVITLQSFSKTYAMPGFRVGYAAGPEKIIDGLKKLHIFTSLTGSTISQIAALEALTGTQKYVCKMVDEYDRRRKMITRRLNEIDGFECVKPNGAFYAFPNIKAFKKKSFVFAEWLLKNAKVACVPGTEFGKYGEGYVRFSYATAYDKIEKAMDRIEKSTKKLKT
ncbi:MAG: pyridoxal phosphate-dependent aminotransferase [Nanoarchaeota archaeon]